MQMHVNTCTHIQTTSPRRPVKPESPMDGCIVISIVYLLLRFQAHRSSLLLQPTISEKISHPGVRGMPPDLLLKIKRGFLHQFCAQSISAGCTYMSKGLFPLHFPGRENERQMYCSNAMPIICIKGKSAEWEKGKNLQNGEKWALSF